MFQTIQTNNAPMAIGPYSQAVILEHVGLVFTAGQLGVIPGTGEMISGGAEAQTRQAIENIKAILEAAGSSLAKVVKTTVFLQNMDDFNTMNKIYAGFFATHYPARSTVQVGRLPKDALIEIEVVAEK
jgi:2-iminobutanoate/2-iminopropanoate deaminase